MAGPFKRDRALPQFVAEQKFLTPTSGAEGVEAVLAILEGRWKLLILFHLFGGKLRRFCELERDGIVRRIVHPQVPPKVEYGLTDWGQALCPVLDALLKWAASAVKLQQPTTGAGDLTHRAGS
jgi:DNA-binding HxlR family transcriptional regulator